MDIKIDSPDYFRHLRDRVGIVSEEDLANMLGVKPITVGRWRRAGKGPAAIRLTYHHIFYRLPDIHEWLFNLAAGAVDAEALAAETSIVDSEAARAVELPVVDVDAPAFPNTDDLPDERDTAYAAA